MSKVYYSPFIPTFSGNGLPVANAKLYFFYTETTDLAPIFQDAALTIPMANPVISDGAARYPNIYLDENIAFCVRETGPDDVPLADDIDPYIPGMALIVTPALAEFTDPSGSSLVGHQPIGAGARINVTAAEAMNEFVFADQFTGYDADGGAGNDSAAAIQAANLVAISRNKTLILHGNPRIKTTVTLNAPTRWQMQGQKLKPGFLGGGSFIIKDEGLLGDAIVITNNAFGTVLEGIGLIGDVGNTGDGFYIYGNSITLDGCAVQAMGQDGVRVGQKAAGAFNANSVRLINLMSGYNIRDGIHMDDAGEGPINCNAGLISHPQLFNNGGHGLYMDHAQLGNTVTAPLCEENTGYGIYLTANTLLNLFMGGDIEGNTAGNIFEATPRLNRFQNVIVLGSAYNSHQLNGGFIPTVVGSTAAGAGTYSVQKGFWTLRERTIEFWIELVWSAHTGTGDLRVGGFPIAALTTDPNVPGEVACEIISSGIALAAGAQPKATFNHNISQVRVWTLNAGTLALLTMQSAGTLYIRGCYEPLLPS